ncbi:MAG: hypothetical protein ABR584_02075 [Candidatus Baltobacteraceae bacterium]
MIERTRPAAPAAGAARVRKKSGGEAAAIADTFAQEREEQAAFVVQQAAFDLQMQQKTELQREANALRDLQIEQMKRDDEIVKKLIGMI